MFDDLINQGLEWLKTTSNRDLFLQTIGAAGTIAGVGWAAYERFIGRKHDYAEFMRALKEQGAERDKLRTERDQLQARLQSEIIRLKDMHAAEIKHVLTETRLAGAVNSHGQSLLQLSADIRVLVEKTTGAVFPAPETNGHDVLGRGPLPHYEVAPGTPLPDSSNITLVRDIASVNDEFVEFIIRRFVATYGTYAVKHGAAAIGDKVLFTGQGYLETPGGGWEADEGLVSDRYPVILGVTMILPNFEEQLLGVVAGERREEAVRFPDDFYEPISAGKYARFDITVDEVQAPVGNLFTPQFLNQLGFPSYAAFKASIRERAAADLVRASKMRTSRRLSKILVEKNAAVRVPQDLIEQQVLTDWDRAQREGLPEGRPTDFQSYRTYKWADAEKTAKTWAIVAALEPLAARDGYAPSNSITHSYDLPVFRWLIEKKTSIREHSVPPTDLITALAF